VVTELKSTRAAVKTYLSRVLDPIKTSLRKTLGVRDQEDLIWFLIRVESPAHIQILAALLFLGLFYTLSALYKPYSHLGWAMMLMASIVLHEVGHLIVFRLGGIRCKIMFIFPFGALAVPVSKDEDALSDKLPHYVLSWFILAGLITNILLMLAGRIFESFGGPVLGKLGAELAYINLNLVFLNILPIWKLDGMQFWKVIFNSIKRESKAREIATPFLVIGFVMTGLFFVMPHNFWQTWLMTILHNMVWWTIPLIIGAGVWKAHKIEKTETFTGQPMKLLQVRYMALLYATLVVIAIGIGVRQIYWYN